MIGVFAGCLCVSVFFLEKIRRFFTSLNFVFLVGIFKYELDIQRLSPAWLMLVDCENNTPLLEICDSERSMISNQSHDTGNVGFILVLLKNLRMKDSERWSISSPVLASVYSVLLSSNKINSKKTQIYTE